MTENSHFLVISRVRFRVRVRANRTVSAKGPELEKPPPASHISLTSQFKPCLLRAEPSFSSRAGAKPDGRLARLGSCGTLLISVQTGFSLSSFRVPGQNT